MGISFPSDGLREVCTALIIRLALTLPSSCYTSSPARPTEPRYLRAQSRASPCCIPIGSQLPHLGDAGDQERIPRACQHLRLLRLPHLFTSPCGVIRPSYTISQSHLCYLSLSIAGFETVSYNHSYQARRPPLRTPLRTFCLLLPSSSDTSSGVQRKDGAA